MDYVVKLEKSTKLGNFLVLPDGSLLKTGKVEAYYGPNYLGVYDVEKIAKSLSKFREEAREIREARSKDVEMAASLGTIILHSQSLDEVVKSLAKKYFS